MSLVKKAYSDTDHGQIHYHFSAPASQGQARAHESIPVLLLHMSASSSKSFIAIMELLSSSGYYCYAPDMPGFGSSFDPSDDPPSIGWYAGVFFAAFARMPAFLHGCHIIGHHSGAIIGTELAVTRTAFVKSLTMVGPALMSEAERKEMAKTFFDPFNKPVTSGDHLLKTWKYLLWEGTPQEDLQLLQRETLDHLRAWKGRSQIYACVWGYDAEAGLRKIDEECQILALCAPDDILWPYFKNVESVGRRVVKKVIRGGNFGPDLDAQGIWKAFIDM